MTSRKTLKGNGETICYCRIKKYLKLDAVRRLRREAKIHIKGSTEGSI